MATGIGLYTPGMATLTTALTGAERIAVDTNLADGLVPQTAGLSPLHLSSGAAASSIPLTGFDIQLPDDVSFYAIIPAGTLATGNFDLPLNPYPGQQITIMSTQTQTAMTVTAPSGYTIVGSATALVAATAISYRLLGTVWYLVR